MRRIKTDYPGVFYRNADRIGGKGIERVYYVLFKKAGIDGKVKLLEEKVGRQYADGMTPAKAARIRTDRIEGRRKSRKEIREEQRADKAPWTIESLWKEYKLNRSELKGIVQDECRFNLYISPHVGKIYPSELVPKDLDPINKLLKSKSPATARNTLELLRRIINYGVDEQSCTAPNFKIKMPKVNNLKTEDLSGEQLEKLLRILRSGIITEKDGSQTILDIDARDAMLLALSSGMRRGEIFRLQWDDLDFRRGFINIRDPKGGTDQTIPMSDAARQVLKSRLQDKGSPFVFPAKRKRKGNDEPSHRADASKQFRMIRDAAGLPKDFRPMHGLRHAFASHLASSGEVDLYTIQRLLTHKSPSQTQRYAHLRDETLRNASNIVGKLVQSKGE